MTDYGSGDLVDITVTGARVDKEDARWLNVLLGAYRLKVPLDAEGVTVVRTVPADWPPQVGDLWRGGFGVLLFTIEDRHGNPLMDCVDGGRHGPDYVLGRYSPLTLVHREEAS
jgi:hypothetical protein